MNQLAAVPGVARGIKKTILKQEEFEFFNLCFPPGTRYPWISPRAQVPIDFPQVPGAHRFPKKTSAHLV